jgi:hypothetical protein
MKWSSVSVDRVMVHYLPTERDTDDPVALFTDSEIPLDADLRRYFRDKIAERLEEKGLAVVQDKTGDPTVTDAIADVVEQPRHLVEASKRIATRLDDIQNGTMSSGLLAVVLGVAEDKPAVSIVKLEEQRGIRFAIKEQDGKYVADMELLRNLTLTDKTKVYKTALLRAGSGGGSTVTGWVADDQRATAEGVQVATFFLSHFLGCKPRLPAAQLTYDFVRAANASFHLDVQSPERKGRYQVALLSTMQDKTSEVRPSEFAKRHLESQDRPKFLERVREAGVDPDSTFPKDTSRVRVSGFKMTFDSGMVLVGSKDALENNVEMPKETDDPVALHDSIARLLSGS